MEFGGIRGDREELIVKRCKNLEARSQIFLLTEMKSESEVHKIGNSKGEKLSHAQF